MTSKEAVFIKVSSRVRPLPSSEEDEVIDYEVERLPSVQVLPKVDGKASLKILTSPYF